MVFEINFSLNKIIHPWWISIIKCYVFVWNKMVPLLAVKLLTKEDDYTHSNMIRSNIPTFLPTLPQTKLQPSFPLENTNTMQHYINSIMDTSTNKTWFLLTGQLTQILAQLDLVWSLKKGWNNTPIVIAKAVKCMGSTYFGGKRSRKKKQQNMPPSPSNNGVHIFPDCKSAILAV